MKNERSMLNLDREMIYQITVPGELDAGWTDWNGQVTVTYDSSRAGQPVTCLTGRFDQAGLQGILRRLYGLGIPLISVMLLDVDLS